MARFELILERTDVMIDRIIRRAYNSTSRTADVYEPLGIWSVEVICKFMFNCGMSPDEHEFSTMLKAMEGSPPTFFIDRAFPWLRRLKLEASLPGPIGHAYRSSAQWHKETARLLAEFQKRDLSTEEKLGFVGGHVFLTPHKTLGRTLTFNEAVGEAMGLALAGSSVTQHTLTYLLYELAKPEGQAIQEKLRREVQEVGDEGPAIMDLRYLAAVIKETHRVHPAIMSTLPRILTHPLAVQDTDITLPPGTIVGMQNFVHHRDPVLFPEPDSFIPERWLEGHALNQGVTLKDMDEALTPYSLGPRVCLGQTLAKIQLPLSVTRLLKRVKFTLSNEMTEDDMFGQDSWAVKIKGGKLLLQIQVLEKQK
ncbi:heme binding [Ascochyta rabiei]|uniref:Heme binding n=2 Tax=Didymella rabiei TaxID=5454 RepID=A0A163AY81_DIDRA|nr:heme binding [Ascochyta rabiei]